MQFLLTYFSVFSLLLVAVPNSNALPDLDGRIVGGTFANINEFPYQVSIQMKNRHICGGSVIHYQYILTAAHCVDGEQARLFSVVAGTHSLAQGGHRFAVASIQVHERFDPETEDYDIAILRLGSKLPFGPNILPIALPEHKEKARTNSYGIVTGWGYTNESGSISVNLQQVPVPVISKKSCEQLLKSQITPRMICAGYIVGGKDSCQGDSGGPLVINGKLHGIVSWGYGCARPKMPGVYAKVSELRDWVKTLINY